MVDKVEWQSPAAGSLASLIELQEWVSPTLVATFNGDASLVDYILWSGTLPEDLQLINDSNSPINTINGIVREMDDYVPEYVEPPGFTYDNDDTAGGDYATYGSALAGSRTFTFTIRAYHSGDYVVDSNNMFDPDSYADRTFSITVLNNYSSDRDRFVVRYFEGQKLLYDGNQELDPEEWIIQQKQDGYYD